MVQHSFLGKLAEHVVNVMMVVALMPNLICCSVDRIHQYYTCRLNYILITNIKSDGAEGHAHLYTRSTNKLEYLQKVNLSMRDGLARGRGGTQSRLQQLHALRDHGGDLLRA